MDPEVHVQRFESIEAVVEHVLSVVTGHVVCVIGRRDQCAEVEAMLRRTLGRENVLAGQPGELRLKSGGMLRLFSNRRSFRSRAAKMDNLVRRGLRPWVVVYADDHGGWESRDFKSWRLRGLLKPPPTVSYWLLHPGL